MYQEYCKINMAGHAATWYTGIHVANSPVLSSFVNKELNREMPDNTS